MARLLFKLSNVPDDEAQDIRDLLNAHDIYFYETNAGFWRVGLDAIWLPDSSQEDQARELMLAYQRERTESQRKNFAELVEQGKVLGLWQHFCLQPIRFIAALLAIIFVASLTLVPFLMLLKK